MNRKAIIFGIRGYKLKKDEKLFFKKTKPWGIILFSRNIKSFSQLKSLIDDIKKTLNHKKCPVLIDVEGGKVSRLNKIIDLSNFSQDYFANLYKRNKKLFSIHYKIYINTVCNIFKKVGININTVPVLDVRRNKSHNIIGTRSFSKNPAIVSKLGSLCIDFYEKNKIATVVKHIPGHGLSKCDSHFKTPIIRTSKKELVEKDFKDLVFDRFGSRDELDDLAGAFNKMKHNLKDKYFLKNKEIKMLQTKLEKLLSPPFYKQYFHEKPVVFCNLYLLIN